MKKWKKVLLHVLAVLLLILPPVLTLKKKEASKC